MSAVGGRRFADVLTEGLQRRGMSLVTLHNALAARGTPMSLAALSYWRAGLRQPEQEQSIRAVVAIEEILGLFPGELESLVSPGRRRMPRSDVFTVYPPDRREVMRRLLRELGMSTPYDEVIEREVTTKVDLDERGHGVRLTHISALESIVNGAGRFALMTAGDSPDEPPPKFTALAGYRVGRVLRDKKSMVTVAEMLLDEELPFGETTVVEQEVELDWSDAEIAYWAWPRVKSATMWIRFHPDKVPARCETFTVVDGVEEAEAVSIYGNSVHRTVSSFGPGTFGVRWFWEGD